MLRTLKTLGLSLVCLGSLHAGARSSAALQESAHEKQGTFQESTHQKQETLQESSHQKQETLQQSPRQKQESTVASRAQSANAQRLAQYANQQRASQQEIDATALELKQNIARLEQLRSRYPNSPELERTISQLQNSLTQLQQQTRQIQQQQAAQASRLQNSKVVDDATLGAAAQQTQRLQQISAAARSNAQQADRMTNLTIDNLNRASAAKPPPVEAPKTRPTQTIDRSTASPSGGATVAPPDTSRATAGVAPPPTQPPATRPQPTQPPTTQPSATQPSATQPPPTQPPTTQPSVTQPSATQPAGSQPPATQSAATQPSPTEAQSTQPAQTEPSSTESPSTQPTQTQPPPTPASGSPDETGWFNKLANGLLKYSVPEIMLWKVPSTVTVQIQGEKAADSGPIDQQTGQAPIKVARRMKVLVSAPDNPDEFIIVPEADTQLEQYVPEDGPTTWHFSVTPRYTATAQKLVVQAWVIYDANTERELPVYTQAVNVHIPSVWECIKRMIQGDPDYWAKYGLPGGAGFVFLSGLVAGIWKWLRRKKKTRNGVGRRKKPRPQPAGGD